MLYVDIILLNYIIIIILEHPNHSQQEKVRLRTLPPGIKSPWSNLLLKHMFWTDNSKFQVHLSHHDHIINHSIPQTTFRCITVAIIGVSLFISLLIPNIELVLGLVGSTIGVLVCVVFPAACFVNLTFKDTNERLLAKVS